MFENALIPLLYILGAAQGAFLAFSLFFSPSGSHRANVFLGLYTMMLVLTLIEYFLSYTGVTEFNLQLRALLWSREFMLGVFVYFYARELTQPGAYHLQGRQLLHFLPAVIHLVIILPLVVMPTEEIMPILNGDVELGLVGQTWHFVFTKVTFVAETLHLPIYLLLSLRRLKRHEVLVEQNFSYKEKVSLRWLSNLLIGNLLIYLIWALEDFLGIGAGARVALGLSMVALIYGMGYLGLRQPLIFVSQRYFESLKPASDAPAPAVPLTVVTDDAPPVEIDDKYQKSSLSSELAAQLIDELDRHMQETKAHLAPQLSLPQLASQMGVSVNYLSQAINEQRNQNFFDFVNSYRIKHVVESLKADHNQTILALGLDAGFNSKSAFYTAFKKHQGMTPGEFRKAFAQAS